MYSAFQSNNDEQDTETFSLDAPGMDELVATAALNSRIKFNNTDVEFSRREIMGDATETGLARFAGRSLSDYDAYLREFPKVFEVPFNSMNKWALVIVNKPHDTGRFVSYIKGAPERVLAKSTTYLKNGKVLPIDNVYKESYEVAYNVCFSFPGGVNTSLILVCSTWLHVVTASLAVRSTSFQKTDTLRILHSRIRIRTTLTANTVSWV